MENHGHEKYWFRAKRYGWGWGLPTTWQGWAVLLGYIVAITAAGFLLPPHRFPAIFPTVVFALTGLLVGVCYIKGEPPGWRWGGEDELP